MKLQFIALGMACLLSITACGGSGDASSLAMQDSTAPTTTNPIKTTAVSSGNTVQSTAKLEAPAISEVRIVEAVSAEDMPAVQTLANGDHLVLAELPAVVNIEAVAANPAKTGSVSFVLEGPKRINRTENTAIFTLADAFVNLDLTQNGLPEGSYTLWVTPYSGQNGTGAAGVTVTTTFTVSATQPQPASLVPAITDVQLLEVVSASNFSAIGSIKDGDTLYRSELPNLINVEAVSADAGNTGSVGFVLSGPKSIERIENYASYTLRNTSSSFDLSKGDLPVGDYSLAITPYSERNLAGEAGKTLSLNFTVKEKRAAGPAIGSLQLVEFVATNEYRSIRALEDGATLVLGELPALVNIEAVSADPAKTGSVDFVLEGPQGVARYENTAIYTLADAHYNFDTTAGGLPAGEYTLRATAYTGSDRSGDAGDVHTVHFTVVDAAPAKVPAITGVQLLKSDVSGQFTAVRALQDGDAIAQSELPSQFNLEALSADPAGTGSVAFSLQGPRSINRYENTAIYTLADAYYNLDANSGGLPAGDYTLSVTPYTGADLTGDAGKTYVMNFTVAADNAKVEPEPAPLPQPEPAPLPEPEPAPLPAPEPAPLPNPVPAIASIQVIGYVAPGSYKVVDELVNGDVLDLGALPGTINFEAVSTDASATGSVAFELTGPVSLNRVENTAIYTMANETQNLVLVDQDLPVGSYTLKVTPYADANASGQAGYSYQVKFSVTGKALPVYAQPTANDDSYYGDENVTVKVSADTGVLSNDTVEAPGTPEVYVAKRPAHGSLTLNRDGSFTYTPDQGFTGIDSFEYMLVDSSGAEDPGYVSLNIASASASDSGFTPIVASSDTRTVYVSSSEGLDSNNGYSINAPVRTLDKAFSLVRNGYPDHVLLKRGDVWVDQDLNGVKSGRSESEPAVVAFYGDYGDRPKLKTSGNTMNVNRLYHVNFIGLSLEAYKLNPADRAFDGHSSANIRMVGDFEDILFEDMKLRFIEFVIQGWEGTPRDIHIRRSMILDKYSAGTSYNRNSRPSGIYTDRGDGLIVEDNVWDHNGWNAEVVGAGANMFNHNLYISEKGNNGNRIVVRNNIITRGSALGVHGRPGGRYENNFFARNAIGLQMGYHGGPALSAGTIAYARDNVITEGLNMNRGIDACSDSSICTGAIWGLQVENLGEADVRVEGNIVSNRLFQYQGYVSGIRQEPQAKYSNNIVYRWESTSQGTNNGYPDPDRTLADYNASLGGARSFEDFIHQVRNRPLQQWDERYSADAINDYIRAGFGR